MQIENQSHLHPDPLQDHFHQHRRRQPLHDMLALLLPEVQPHWQMLDNLLRHRLHLKD
jgi:hypothetical protein